jgi:hypothetical protein
MNFRLFALVFAVLLPTVVCSQPQSETVPNFNKHVLPILQDHCQVCHRPGEIAPMSLLSYEQVRPWVTSIRDKVSRRTMPPWHADSRYGEFANDARLSDGEIRTILSWIDGGSPRGSDADLPPAKQFVDGWNIGTPDVVLTMPTPQRIVNTGTDEYLYFALPTNFSEDRFVKAIEIRPGNRRIVHHVLAYVQPGGTGAPSRGNVERYNQIAGANFFRGEGFSIHVTDDAPVHDDGCGLPNGGSALSGDVSGGARPMVAVFTPGTQPTVMPDGVGQKIPAGSEILLQIHYTKTGKEEYDTTSVGLVFLQQEPTKLMLDRWVQNYYFKVPPNAANHEVNGCYTFDKDVSLLSFLPHMHLRGKDMEYKAIYPDGRSQILFRVPDYDFGWQLWYTLKKPLHIPRGTRIEVTAHFDNSVARRSNPNANASVRWGDPTSDEMMIGMINYIVEDKQ